MGSVLVVPLLAGGDVGASGETPSRNVIMQF